LKLARRKNKRRSRRGPMKGFEPDFSIRCLQCARSVHNAFGDRKGTIFMCECGEGVETTKVPDGKVLLAQGERA